MIVVYVVVGCCWSVLLVLRGVSVVLIVCVPLNRRVNQAIPYLPPLMSLSEISFGSIVRSDLSPRRSLEPRSPPTFAVSSLRHV